MDLGKIYDFDLILLDLAPTMSDRIIGNPDGPVEYEIENFVCCRGCGQPVDMRDLVAVIHHSGGPHRPMDAEQAFRLVGHTALRDGLIAGAVIVMRGYDKG